MNFRCCEEMIESGMLILEAQNHIIACNFFPKYFKTNKKMKNFFKELYFYHLDILYLLWY